MRLRNIAHPLLALAWLFLAGFASAQAQPALPAGVERVLSLEGVTEYRLANGLRVLLVPDASRPTITVNITYLVGSRHEGYGETGMAHLLEHMLFKGTAKRPKLNQEFSPRGAQWNGTTWYDRTNYFETFPATADNLRWALEMEADRMVNSKVSREDLDSEMTVVRNEYERGENEPRRVLLQRVGAVAFDWHNYGNTPIGNRSDIENVGIANLQAFYRRYYQPDNAVLVMAGRFEEPEALAMVAAAFGPIPRPERQLPRFWTVEPTQDGERSVQVRRNGGTPLVTIAYKIPGALHPEAMAADFAADILTTGPSSRLHRLLVESGKATAVSNNNFQTVDPGVIYLHATLAMDGNVEEVQRIMLEAIEKFEPATDAEVNRIKSNFTRSYQQSLSSTQGMALAFSESIARGDWRLYFLARQRVADMRADAIDAAARKYFIRDNRTVGHYIPTDKPVRAEVPAAPTAEVALKDFKGGEALAAAEAFDPSPANIDARTIRTSLSNGMKVAMLPRKTRGNSVSLQMRLHWGDLDSLRGRSTAGAYAGGLFSRGAAGMTRQQIADRWSEMRVTANVLGGFNTIRATRDTLPDAIRFMAKMLRSPDFPATEFEQARTAAIAAAERRRTDVNAIAADRLAKHFNVHAPDDPRYSPSPEETIERLRALKLEDVRAYYKDFYGASDGEIAIVGDFDEKQVLPILEAELGTWKSPRPYRRIPTPYRDVKAVQERIDVPDKANAIFLTRGLINIHGDDPEWPALQVANYIFGGSGTTSRLNGRVRQREGLSYGVSSSLATNRQDPVATFAANASGAPENMGRIERAFQEELERVRTEGFTQAELDAAKSGILQRGIQARSSDDALAGGWVDRLYGGKTYAEIAQDEARIQALTLGQLNAVAKKYLDPGKVSTVVVGTLPK